MTITAWSRFYPEVLPYLPGCPLPVLDNALRNAAIELCDFGLQHRKDITFPTVANQAVYALTVDTETTVAAVIAARHDGGKITAKTTEELAWGGAVWETRVGNYPLHYYLPDTDNIRLYPIPDGVLTVYLTVALRPKRTATGVESFVAEQYLDEICAGALGRLMDLPGKPWTDKVTAAEKKAEFMAGKGQANIDGLRNFSQASISVIPRPFA